MKEFVTFVARQLVDAPGDLSLEEKQGVSGLRSLVLRLPPSEIGKIIGKQGHTIRAIRTLLVSAADRHGEQVQFEVAEQGEAGS